MLDITRENFEEEVLRSDIPVAVDCWASWCGPCKQYSPTFEAVGEQYEGTIKFVKLDTDGNPALARGLGIQALPTTLVFYKGQLANAVEGSLPLDHLQQWLYQTSAALKQYEAQFDAESEEAIAAAAENLKLLDEDGTIPNANNEPAVPPATPSGFTADSLDPRNMSPRGPQQEEDGRYKRTSSGLYIP